MTRTILAGLAGLALLFMGTSSAGEPPAHPQSRPAASQPASRPAHGEHRHGPHDDDDATASHSFADVARWVAIFDDPERDAWQKPAELVAALGLEKGHSVADIGAGTGYFTRYLSTAVGDAGTVYAMDVELNLVGHLRERAEKERTANVVPVLGSFDNPRLPAGALDVILIVDTYHHIDDRLLYFERLKSRLKKGGRLAIVDFFKRESPVGPPVAHKIARDHVVRELTSIGYVLADEPDILPHQYVLLFATGAARQ